MAHSEFLSTVNINKLTTTRGDLSSVSVCLPVPQSWRWATRAGLWFLRWTAPKGWSWEWNPWRRKRPSQVPSGWLWAGSWSTTIRWLFRWVTFNPRVFLTLRRLLSEWNWHRINQHFEFSYSWLEFSSRGTSFHSSFTLDHSIAQLSTFESRLLLHGQSSLLSVKIALLILNSGWSLKYSSNCDFQLQYVRLKNSFSLHSTRSKYWRQLLFL